MHSSAPVSRPGGVVIVAILIIISGALGIISGVLSLIGGSMGADAVVEGTEINGAGFMALGIWGIVLGVVTVLFAIGILRGSRFARAVVTIIELLAIASAVWALIVQHGSAWAHILNIAIPVLIVALLWTGEKTKAFFVR